MGTSHHEPMMRAQDEWHARQGRLELRHQRRPCCAQFWADGVERTQATTRTSVTLGMRGDGDEPMSREANVALLERIVADQRKIIAET